MIIVWSGNEEESTDNEKWIDKEESAHKVESTAKESTDVP